MSIGWNLPPGCTPADIERTFGDDGREDGREEYPSSWAATRLSEVLADPADNQPYTVVYRLRQPGRLVGDGAWHQTLWRMTRSRARQECRRLESELGYNALALPCTVVSDLGAPTVRLPDAEAVLWDDGAYRWFEAEPGAWLQVTTNEEQAR